MRANAAASKSSVPRDSFSTENRAPAGRLRFCAKATPDAAYSSSSIRRRASANVSHCSAQLDMCAMRRHAHASGTPSVLRAKRSVRRSSGMRLSASVCRGVRLTPPAACASGSTIVSAPASAAWRPSAPTATSGTRVSASAPPSSAWSAAKRALQPPSGTNLPAIASQPAARRRPPARKRNKCGTGASASASAHESCSVPGCWPSTLKSANACRRTCAKRRRSGVRRSGGTRKTAGASHPVRSLRRLSAAARNCGSPSSASASVSGSSAANATRAGTPSPASACYAKSAGPQQSALQLAGTASTASVYQLARRPPAATTDTSSGTGGNASASAEMRACGLARTTSPGAESSATASRLRDA